MSKVRASSQATPQPAPCSCGGAACLDTDARRAVGVDPSLKDANLKHLRRIEGQIRGIASMIENERYCADIVTQVAAVRESLHSVARNLMRNHLKHCASHAIQAGGPAQDKMIDELLDLVAKVAR